MLWENDSRQLSWIRGGGWGGHACGPLVYVVVVFHCPEAVVGDAVAVVFHGNCQCIFRSDGNKYSINSSKVGVLEEEGWQRVQVHLRRKYLPLVIELLASLLSITVAALVTHCSATCCCCYRCQSPW